MLVRDLTDGQDVELVLLVREHERRTKRDGAEFLRLTLADRSGQVAAVLWDELDAADAVAAGCAAHVAGRHSVHPRYGAQIVLSAIRPAAEHEADWDALLDGPVRPVEQLEDDLRTLVATIQNPHLTALLRAIFDPATWRVFRVAPAAKRFHQAYRHGLLEHALTVAEGVSALSATFPGIDRDVAVTGALLHDIGKLDAYTTDPVAIEMTDLGKLAGEIPLGYYRVRRTIETLEDFPAELAAGLLHIILAHHGALEHGSPVLPATREATLVHFVDNLGGRLGSFDRLEKELQAGASWSGFDKVLGGGAYFGAASQRSAA